MFVREFTTPVTPGLLAALHVASLYSAWFAPHAMIVMRQAVMMEMHETNEAQLA